VPVDTLELCGRIAVANSCSVVGGSAAVFRISAAVEFGVAGARPPRDRSDIPTFRRFFEANGLAVAGREPYRALAAQLTESWMEWLGEFIEGLPDQRRADAETTVAILDGLLLLRLLVGPVAAERAAGRLGVASAGAKGQDQA
jgi:hypothetical protein